MGAVISAVLRFSRWVRGEPPPRVRVQLDDLRRRRLRLEQEAWVRWARCRHGRRAK